jgi:hypothetical protein
MQKAFLRNLVLQPVEPDLKELSLYKLTLHQLLRSRKLMKFLLNNQFRKVMLTIFKHLQNLLKIILVMKLPKQ